MRKPFFPFSSFKHFIYERYGQSAPEYILLSATVIASVILVVIYVEGVVEQSAEAFENAPEATTLKTACEFAYEMDMSANAFNARYAAQNWTATNCTAFGITLS